MLTITLPEHLAGTTVLAGIAFEDGSATVPMLGSHTQHYFELVGATIAEHAEDASPADPFADLRIGEQLLTDLTVPELRELAKTEGLDVAPKATKPEILGAFLTAFTSED